MSNPYLPPAPPPPYRPRVWPGVLLVGVVLAMLLVPPFVPQLDRTATLFMLMAFAPVFGVAGAVGWWAGFSRVPAVDRTAVLAVFLLPLAVFSAEAVLQRQLPVAPLVYGVPVVLVAWVGWLLVSIPLSGGVRRAGVYLVVAAGWLPNALTRVEQSDSDLVPLLAWRWQPRPEDAFDPRREKAAPTGGTVEVTPDDWAEFRGPHRDGIVRGVTLDVDRFADAKEVWRKPVGPGWGSFAVAGNRLYTIEQQGENEAVVCLSAADGKLIWEHVYPAKFFDYQGGVGPRSTPTVSGGRVFACGATGELRCLNATDGAVVWEKNLTEIGGRRPAWGYAVCPLVARGLVVCYTGGPGGKGVTAFAASDGAVKWQAGKGTHGYSAAQLVTLLGVEQVLMQSSFGIEAFDPTTGAVLWEFAWPLATGNRTTQPLVLGGDSVVLTTGVGQTASKRLTVTKTADGWAAAEVWKSAELSPYFNDGVVHNGHYYGFSGAKFHCVDLGTGEQKWAAPKGTSGKARFTDGTRYGNGQVLLFAEQGLLVVTEAVESFTDTGRVFLLRATPDEHTELASFPGLKGKTWNHAAYSRGRLYLRNGQEAACFQLE